MTCSCPNLVVYRADIMMPHISEHNISYDSILNPGIEKGSDRIFNTMCPCKHTDSDVRTPTHPGHTTRFSEPLTLNIALARPLHFKFNLAQTSGSILLQQDPQKGSVA